MIRVGINGFGRIGRCIYRIIQNKSNIHVNCINDIDSSIANHVYLLNYDSIYGRLDKRVHIDNDRIFDGENEIKFYSSNNIDDVPWDLNKVDIVIDASGTYQNVIRSHQIANNIVSKVIITHSPKDNVDATIIIGVNESSYNDKEHHVISGSICDTNACAPVIKVLDENFQIRNGFITTIHPWLGYQNLLDGNIKSVSSPGHYWKDFALGRSSINSLIPKNTTLIPAIRKVLPNLSKELFAMSFRVPTSIVSASDLTLNFNKKFSKDELLEKFNSLVDNYPNSVIINKDSLYL